MAVKESFTRKVTRVFLVSNLSPIFILISLLLGFVALIVTPREEEPQIVVPFVDIMISFPGASAEEIEKLISTPVERRLMEIDGIEYVYSMSKPGISIITARFRVGEDKEKSLVKLYDKLISSQHLLPPGVKGWSIKGISIDDIPIVTITLWSEKKDDYELRRVADELVDKLQEIRNASTTYTVGGRKREMRVILNPESMLAYNITSLEVMRSIQSFNSNLIAGSFSEQGREVVVESGPYFHSVEELKNLVVGIKDGRPIYLKNIADVIDAPEEITSYTRIGFGPAFNLRNIGFLPERNLEYPAVTIAVAKVKGSNAVHVAEGIIEKIDELKKTVIPNDIHVLITRNYGETANEKVNELIKHLFIAIITIVVLIGLTLGWKEAAIVALAVPITLAVTLFGDLLLGYTINRVTLFALILSLGLLVDDPIVDVENIHRHFKLKIDPPLEATLTAVDEVRPPTIIATFAVMVAILPMYFVTGMMGPYMRPIPFNVSLAMLMSLIVAFTVTPWATYHMLKGEYGREEEVYDIKESMTFKIYRRMMIPFLKNRIISYLFLSFIVLLLIISFMLVYFKYVPVKMLPFDNRNELQIVIDTPEGTTLEETDRIARMVGDYLKTVAEVMDYQIYVGNASPIDFNGMVRHYYMREGSNVADIRVNLAPKYMRKQQSHEIALRIRADIEDIARRTGAKIKIVEIPPGPPVISTIVAEVYGRTDRPYSELIDVSRRVKEIFSKTENVVDIDDTVEDEQKKIYFHIDERKAAIHGISKEEIVQSIMISLNGDQAGIAHIEGERNPVQIKLRFPVSERSSINDLYQIPIKNRENRLIPLAELVKLREGVIEKTIYHKNLKRVVYVFGETAGSSPVYSIIKMWKYFSSNKLPEGYNIVWRGEGEWKITVDVFRDMGLAYIFALAGIYIILVAQTGSFLTPLLIMISIPLTMIGILPGFSILNLISGGKIGQFENPIFFTATAMIGVLALAGIVVRNSVILIDFIQLISEREKGKISLMDAIIEAGSIRIRPIFLTAASAALGSWVITLDPIFSGLAWSLIFGVFASTIFTIAVVPVVYYLIYGKIDSEAHSGGKS